MTRVAPERIRVLHVIDNLQLGGTEKQCFEIVKGLNKEKFDTRVITLNKEGPLFCKYRDQGIPIAEYRIARGFYRPGSILRMLRLASLMRREKIQIVQTYGFYSTIPGVTAAKIAGVPVIIAGKRDLGELLSKEQFLLEKMLWHLCDRIVVNANGLKENLVVHEGVRPESVVVIYNGVNLKHYACNDHVGSVRKPDQEVGMIANFRYQKDHETYLRAASLVLKKNPKVRFVCVGTGPDEKRMQFFSESLGIRDEVAFVGRKEGAELVEVIGRLSISVLASTNEGLPNALMESMALGIPVISNPSGGVPELVEDEVTGYLFPYRRPDILSEKILFLLSHPELSREMGERARRKIRKQFTVDLMIGRYEKLYETLVNTHGDCTAVE